MPKKKTEETPETVLPEKEAVQPEVIDDDDFADAHPAVVPTPVEEKKEEPEPEPEMEEEPEPEEEREPEKDSYEYESESLEKIETARQVWIQKFKKSSRIKTIVSIVALLAILSAWLVPTLLIKDQGLLPMYIGLGAAVVGAIGLFVYNAFNRKKDQTLIHEYFIAFYQGLNDYTLLGNGVESYEGKVEDRISQEEFDAANLYPEARQIGSRDNVVFSYQGMDCALADAAAQKDSGKGLVTCFVGKYLRTHNNLELSEEGLTVYFKGGKRALVPASLADKTTLAKEKKVEFYGDPSDKKKIMTEKVRSAMSEIKTNKLLCDATIVFKSGKTYFFLGYEDDIMVLPSEKPFNPKYVMEYKQQLKTILDFALLFNREKKEKEEA